MPAEQLHGVGGVGGGVALVEPVQRLFVDGLEGADDEQAPGGGELRPEIPVAEDVLDLDGAIERQLRPAFVHGGDDAPGVLRPVEEVGIPEGDVPGTAGDEALDVGEDDVLRHDPDPPVVDDRYRAVPATMQAPVAGLDVPDRPLFTDYGQVAVTLQGWQPVSGRVPPPASAVRER